jgi:transposase InsO family protein
LITRYYNQRRPHRALGGRTSLVAVNTRIKAGPPDEWSPPTNFRIRRDRVDS